MAARKESPVITDMLHSLNEQSGAVFWKIADSGLQQRFAVKKRYDIAGHIDGRYKPIEVKYYDYLRPFGLKELASHQIDALWEDRCNGSDAYVVLGVKPIRSTPKHKRVSYRLYIFCISELIMEERLTTAQMEQRSYIEAQRVTEVYTNKKGEVAERRAWRFPKLGEVL